MSIWDDDYDGDRVEEFYDKVDEDDDEGDDYYEPESAFLDLSRL